MPKDRSAGVSLEIGGIVLAVEWKGDDGSFSIGEAHRGFLSDKQPDVTFTVESGSYPDLALWEKVFDSGGPWALCRQHGGWCFIIPSPAVTSRPHRVAVVDTDFRNGDIYVCAREVDQAPTLYPLAYPLEELLFVNLLSLGRGVPFHACAVSDSGRGFIFAGSSGAGKSTMADLWKDQEGVIILSDDRVIVREMDERFWVYGTPWHGDVKLCSPERAPLDGIFFLHHGEQNTAAPLQATRAAASLFARSFPTYWNSEGVAFSLDFLSRMGQAVPCYDLEFVADGSVIDYVRRTVGDAYPA